MKKTRSLMPHCPLWMPKRPFIMLLSLVLAVTASGCSALSLYGLIMFRQSIHRAAANIFLGIIGAHLGIVCPVALGGTAGVGMARHVLVSVYSLALYILFLGMLALGLANFILLWPERKDFQRLCPTQHRSLTRDECDTRFRIFFGLTLGLWAVSVIIASSLSSLSRRYAKALAEKRYSSTYKMTGPYGNGYTAGMV